MMQICIFLDIDKCQMSSWGRTPKFPTKYEHLKLPQTMKTLSWKLILFWSFYAMAAFY